MKIKNQYFTTILSSYTIFNNIENGFNLKKLQPYIFIDVKQHSQTPIVPDYFFKEIEEYIFKDSEILSKYILRCFDELSESLYIKNNNIYVKEEEFEEWQSIITRVSPYMLVSYFLWKENKLELLTNLKSYLPSIYNKQLEYLFENEKIVDLHIHLNGTTEADFVWKDIMKSPNQFLKEIEKGFIKDNVKEEYFNLGIYNFNEFYKSLDEVREIYMDHNFENFQVIINYLTKDDLNNEFVLKIYKYLIFYNLIYKLLVQQINQTGFEAFQKITENEIREYSEKNYLHRYKQVLTIYNHSNIVLEGRFSPKNTPKKMQQLIDKILIEYKTLVAHFIKQKDSRNISNIITYRDLKLRLDLEKKADILLNFLDKSIIFKNKKYKYRDFIKGIDAASNELYARPEVFSPIFKKFRNHHISGFTFHGGEDFLHLVSGIRYIYEIVEFLEFENGDRIGHATAIGIKPNLWKNRIGKSVIISKGNYLDDLVFTYMILRKNSKFLSDLVKIENEIYKITFDIYKENYSICQLIEVWKLRKEDPNVILGWSNKSFNYKKNNTIIDIYKKYHSKEIIQKYNDKLEINIDFYSNKILKYLQKKTIKLLNKKGIVIESMITSNKLISFYNDYKEHHITRWLLKSPKPIVVIASDDPGIFAINLKNEYSHLYLLLKKELDSEDEIFVYLNKLIKNSQIYKF